MCKDVIERIMLIAIG